MTIKSAYDFKIGRFVAELEIIEALISYLCDSRPFGVIRRLGRAYELKDGI